MTPEQMAQAEQRECAKQGGTNTDGKSEPKDGGEASSPYRGPEENMSGGK